MESDISNISGIILEADNIIWRNRLCVTMNWMKAN
jgi:hypothetical protein